MVKKKLYLISSEGHIQLAAVVITRHFSFPRATTRETA